jgi:hypothetical protein
MARVRMGNGVVRGGMAMYFGVIFDAWVWGNGGTLDGLLGGKMGDFGADWG